MSHALERQRKIEQLVNEKGIVKVTELSGHFGVTEATIRHDLAKLQAENRIIRKHGAAVSIRFMQSEPGEMTGALGYGTVVREAAVAQFPERMMMYAREKEEIAREAVGLIEPYDRIVMDASSTTFYVARLLPPDLPVTVLTHSLQVMLELQKKPKVEVIATGGILSRDTQSLIGPLSERTIGRYNVNKAFISCMGIDFRYGITEQSELQMLVKRKMIEMAEKVYLLADHSKFGSKNFTYLADFDQIELIVTDAGLARAHREEMDRLGIRYRLAGRGV